ncbi:beta strand repeat-containing protein [Candidatus Chromulinivorax destructor]|uniref:S-layer family protein n=1 Tax=Candidatus Chromulinivorax destructor TaxID=2066483 RepID=A0A345ZCM5_9BACT|nr:S-layer family protein [Candidatus Chromulinivorax destructor]AXK61042.1 hypothetical protein C0J27_04905 [Candidatus Chromulinivorax destructor]
MSVKKKSKSRCFFTMFLAGSLCGSINYMQADPDASSDDLSEEPQHRIQITGALNVTLAAIDTAVEVLTGGNPTVNLSTVQDNGVPTGTVIVGGTTYTPHTNDLTSLSLGVSTIKGTDFNPATDSLKAISDVVSSFNADLDGVATSAQSDDIMGAGFDSTTDSLKAISDVVSTLDLNNVATVANQTTQGLVPLATSAQAVDIMGAGFDTTTDSLKVISDVISTLDLNNVATLANQTTQGLVALATNAQAVDILQGSTASGTVIVGGTTYTADTNDLTSISRAISAVQGASFNTATDSLKAISDTVDALNLELDGVATSTQSDTIIANQTSQGTGALATSAQALAIQGTTFATGTDSLEAISNNNISVPFATAANLATLQTTANTINTNVTTLGTAALATNAQAVDILQGSTASGTVITGGTTYTADTNDLTSISRALSAIEGAGFATGTDSLKVISDGTDTIIANQTSQGTGALATAANLATLQTTANTINTNVTTLGTAALATSAQAVAIQGATFATGTDSLEAISNNNISVPFATSAQVGTLTNTGGTATIGAILGDAANISFATRLTTIDTEVGVIDGIVDNILVDTANILANQTSQGTDPLSTSAQAVDILQGSTASGTVITGGTTYTADTNDLTSISRALSAIEGAGFATGTDSLKVISDGTDTIIANQTSQGTGALATSAQALAIQGATFATGTDSLEAISNNNISVPFATAANLATLQTTANTINTNVTTLGTAALATNAQAVDILQGSTASGTVITGGTTYTADTNDLTSISRALSAIEGAGFATGTDSLKVISDGTDTIIANQTSQGTGALATAANLATLQTTANTINTNVTTLGTAALATNAQAVDILQGSTASGTVITGGTTYTADTNDLTSISRALSAIEGAGFATGTDSLKVISDGTDTIIANQTSQGTGALATAANLATLQTTANTINTNVTTLGTAALATSAQAVAIQGATFATGTDSLEAISNNNISVPFATSAQVGTLTNTGGTATIGAILGDAANISFATRLTTIDTEVGVIDGIVDNILVDTANILANQTSQGTDPLSTSAQAVDILQGSTASGTVITGGTTYTADTNDLTSISRALSAIEGAGFATGTDSLKVISDGTDTIIANQTSQGTGALATAANLATLQTTANTINTNVTTLGTAALATSAQAVDIQGATFDTATDSLEAISNALVVVDGVVDDILVDTGTTLPAQIAVLGSSALATSAQAVAILNNQTSQGTGTLATAANLSTTNTTVNTINTNLGNPAAVIGVPSIAASLNNIQGAGFSSGTDSLKVISDDTDTIIANQTSQGTGALATSAQAVAIQGATFATGTDSLEAISNNNISVPFATAANLATLQTTANTINTNVTTLGTAALATNAQAVDILQGSTASGTVITGGTTYTADTNDLTSISRALSAIEGAGFATGTDSLKVISDGTDTIIANQTSQGTGALATSAQAVAIQGLGFVTGTDSLKAISDNTISVPFATAAALSTTNSTVSTINTNLGDPAVGTVAGNIGSPVVNTAASTLALVLGDPTASTPSASASIAAALGGIEGASFTTGLAALFIISRQTALAQVVAAASSSAIITDATAGGVGFLNFNITLANLRAAIITATAVGGQTKVNIDAITSTADLAFTSAATETITAPFTQAAYQAALQALSLASINWSAFYS